jgi:hypothetical protein
MIMLQVFPADLLQTLWKILSTILLCTSAVWLFKVGAFFFDIWKRELLLRSSAIPKGVSRRELLATVQEGPRKWVRWDKQWGPIYYLRVLHKHVSISLYQRAAFSRSILLIQLWHPCQGVQNPLVHQNEGFCFIGPTLTTACLYTDCSCVPFVFWLFLPASSLATNRVLFQHINA